MPPNDDNAIPWVRPVGTHDAGSRGSGVCIGRRAVLTCLHLFCRWNPGDPASAADLSLRVRERAAVWDETGTPVRPAEAMVWPDLDLVLLTFARDLVRSVPAVLAGLTEGGLRSLRSGSLAACGYPGDTGGMTLQTALPTDDAGIKMARVSGFQGEIENIQIGGGVPAGMSGGALVYRGHSLSPLFGILQLGGSGSVASAARTTGCFLPLLVRKGVWPEQLLFWDDIAGGGTGFEQRFEQRREWTTRLFGWSRNILTLKLKVKPPVDRERSVELRFSIVPPGRSGKSGGGAVERPLAIMTAPLTCGQLAAARGEACAPEVVNRMATDLTWRDAGEVATQLSERLRMTLRLPRADEWLFAVTAGQGPGSRMAGNRWEIDPPPEGRLEWIADRRSTGADSWTALYGTGDGINFGRGNRSPQIGFRLVAELCGLPVKRAAGGD